MPSISYKHPPKNQIKDKYKKIPLTNSNSPPRLSPQPLQTRHLPQPHLRGLDSTPTRPRPLPLHGAPLNPMHPRRRHPHAPIKPHLRRISRSISSTSHPDPKSCWEMIGLTSRRSKAAPPRISAQAPARRAPPLLFRREPRPHHVPLALDPLRFRLSGMADECFECAEPIRRFGQPAEGIR